VARDLDFSVPSTDLGPRTARRLAEPVRSVVGDALFRDLELLISELVANSVRYGGGDTSPPIDVRVHAARGFARVEVVDRGPGFDPPSHPRPRSDRSGGYGLVLLDALTSRWRAERIDGGMRMWFELGMPRPGDRVGRWLRRGGTLGRGAESVVPAVG